jgi:hypothetical protein
MEQRIIILFLCSSFIFGCSSTLLERATIIAPENALSKIEPTKNLVTGLSCRHSFGLINLIQLQSGNTPPNIDEAIRNALTKAPQSNALVNAKIKTHQTYAVFYGKTCLEIEGEPSKL